MLDETVRRNRAELIRRERLVQADVIRAYGETIRRIKAQLRGLEDPNDLQRRRALEQRLAAIQAELQQFGRYAASAITALQQGTVQQGLQDAYTLTREAMGAAQVGLEFRPPDFRIVQALAGRASDGTPLAELFDEIAQDAAGLVRSELLQGAVNGNSPRETARQIARVSSIPRSRALLIARTESISAYRTVTLETYRANSQVVTEWVWMAQLDKRTCPVCWAMHGTTHRPDEQMDSHPGCRCTPAPKTRSWAELGFEGIEDTRPTIKPGADVFDTLDPATQRAILGPGKHDAYQAGDLTLADLVARTSHPRWGAGRRERSLRELTRT